MEYSDFDPTQPKVKRERYLLGYLGSVETLVYKGTGVVCQAVRRILRNSSQEPPVSQSCILEVSDQGLRMVDRSKPRVSARDHSFFLLRTLYSYFLFWSNIRINQILIVPTRRLQKSQGPCHDYFYSLKNVSFCAFHPRDHRYLGFITKHPTLQRFACHVFIGQESTRPVAEAVGWAQKYNKRREHKYTLLCQWIVEHEIWIETYLPPANQFQTMYYLINNFHFFTTIILLQVRIIIAVICT